jgi:hypothetical protein
MDFMALAEPKDLSLSPKSNSSSILPALSAPALFSTFFFSSFPYGPASLYFFFFSWPVLRLFDTSKLFPPFSFLFCKTIVRESRIFSMKKKRNPTPPKEKQHVGQQEQKLLWNL